jgi:hypothetical protein
MLASVTAVSGDEEARISGAFVLRGRFLDDG